MVSQPFSRGSVGPLGELWRLLRTRWWLTGRTLLRLRHLAPHSVLPWLHPCRRRRGLLPRPPLSHASHRRLTVQRL